MTEGATLPVEPADPPERMVKVVNPVLRVLLRSPLHGVASKQIMLLHLTGRRTGRRFSIPVGYHDVEGVLTVLTGSRWRHNLRGGAAVEVTLRGERRPGQGDLVEDVDEVARVYGILIGRVGLDGVRRLGLKVNEQRTPEHPELRAALGTRALVRIRL